MRERDLRSLEFDKVIGLVSELAVSEPGRQAVLRIRPSTHPDEVRERLRAGAEMVELRAHAGSLPMFEFPDLRGLFLAAAREGAVLNGESLVTIRDFALGARHVASFLRSRVESFPRVGAHASNLLVPKELADAMLRALADDGSLLDDASPELKRLRNRLREERVQLEARLMRSLSQPGMEQFISDSLVTLRNRRFVLPMKLNHSERMEGIVQDRSVSGETLFVEPMWAVDLNNRLMMLESEVEAEEHRILTRLTAMVRGYVTELGMTFDAMVALDALNAQAIFAERFRCIEPQTDADGIELVEARHPLLMRSGREVVPIDIAIPADRKGIVISGPNTGGKTVALKTLGLLSLMAQAGLLIPAREGSRVSIFRSVFADIGDEQSIESSLSTFSGHIANLSSLLASLVEPALVVLDEPGAGTDPAEGAALAIGVMNYLAARKCVIAIATHATAVKLHAYSGHGFEVAAVDFDAEHLAPLYRLKPGTIGQSYGLAVAQRLGLPDEVIESAKHTMGETAVELSRSLERLEAERARLDNQSMRLSEQQREFQRKQREALKTAEDARERAATERIKLREEVRTLIADMRREGEDLLREIKSQTKSRHDLGRFLEGAAKRLQHVAPSIDALEEAEQAPLKVGEEVEFGGLRGQLLVLEAGRAVVGRGGLRIEVSPERLRTARRIPRPSAGGKPERMPTVTVSASGTESEQLNLIGMRTSEALHKLEEFLDQAYLTNRREVTIVHGIGSGALKKAVHEYLGSSAYCAAFHEAVPHRGGAGATIVELNL